MKIFIKVRQGFFMSLTLGLTLTTAMGATLDIPSAKTVSTPKMEVVFEDGWLVRWVNKETGEQVVFGAPGLNPTNRDDGPYRPGPWWVDWKLPAPAARADATHGFTVRRLDDTAVEVTQTAQTSSAGEIHAVQWGVRVPYEQVDAVHFPKGMPPARMSGRGLLDLFVNPSHILNGRLGEVSGGGAWRLRFYQIQGKTGGLLIHVDDPELQHFAALEFKKETNGLVIANRSLADPPWTNRYAGCRWVIRQYTGHINAGAQCYQDYLARAFSLTPLKDRPTGWAKRLGFVFVQAPWTEPLPLPGHRRPHYNYSSDWDASLRAGEQWLQNLAQVVPPTNVMFYTSQWKMVPNMDRGLQDNSLDPFFLLMCHKARQMGFHVMLHFNAINLTTDSVTYQRYFAYQAQLKGLPEIEGVVRSVFNNRFMGSTNGPPPGGWAALAGYNVPAGEFTMNPAFEGWRRIFVSVIVGAVKATEADAIHLDVPNPMPDLNNAKYGMNSMQGWRAFAKLLRATLDEHGLRHVAIATEVTPSEPLLPYVDFAQATRGKSAEGFVEGIASGKYNAEATMMVGQSGQDLEQVNRLRAQMESNVKQHGFNEEFVRLFLSKMRELGEPSINSMVVGPFVQSYPHLGCMGPLAANPANTNAAVQNQVMQSLDMWYSMIHDTLPHTSGMRNMFMDTAPYDQLEVIQIYRQQDYSKPNLRRNGRIFGRHDYGKFALARFWADQNPQLLPPREWAHGDIARYGLKDGRQLSVTRAAPTTLRWAFDDGQILAELDLFQGWQNDRVLLSRYEPKWLKNQIDEYVPVEKK